LLLKNDIPRRFVQQIECTSKKTDKAKEGNIFNMRRSMSNFRTGYSKPDLNMTQSGFGMKTDKIKGKEPQNEETARFSMTGINFILYRSSNKTMKKENLFKIRKTDSFYV